jgi:hypothetical protein
MSIQTNIIKNGTYRFTNDGIFAIKNMRPSTKNMCSVEDSNYLFIQTDKVNNILSQSSALSNLINNKFIILDESEPTVIMGMQAFGRGPKNTYNKYIFHRKLIDNREFNENDEVVDDNVVNENDCLKFGECISVANKTGDINKFNQMIKLGESDPVLQSTNKRKFGEDEDKNSLIPSFVKDSEKNNFAIPKNGECYAIVRSEKVKGEADYHIAFVLYTYQNINITLEASADAGNEYYPKFGFYDINPIGCTFHKVFSRHYTNGETIVLKTRNINTILKEIDNEIAENNRNNSKKRKIGSGKKKRIIYIKKKMTKRKGKATNKNKNKKSVKKY